MEAVIIHELIHIKLWGMDQMIESLLYATSYGRIQKQTDAEWGA